jgi:hypothetical protein
MDFSPGRLLLLPVEACVSDLFFGIGLLAPVPVHLSTNALSALALDFFSIVASCVNVFGRCARFVGALDFFSVASCSRFVS